MQQRSDYSRVIGQLQQWDDEHWSLKELELLKTLLMKKIQDISGISLFSYPSLLPDFNSVQTTTSTPLFDNNKPSSALGVWGVKNLKDIITAEPAKTPIKDDIDEEFLKPLTMKACDDEKCPCTYYIQGEDDDVVTGKVKINPKEIFIAGISIESSDSPDARLAAHNELRALLKNTPCRIYQPTGKQYAFFSFKSHREAVRAQLLFSRSTFRDNPIYVSFAHFEQHHDVTRPSENPGIRKSYHISSKTKK